jgi:hypothetical protein
MVGVWGRRGARGGLLVVLVEMEGSVGRDERGVDQVELWPAVDDADDGFSRRRKEGRKWREKFGFLDERRSILCGYVPYVSKVCNAWK